jgi:ribonuclease HII
LSSPAKPADHASSAAGNSAPDCIERTFWERGYGIIAGLDEAGRGPLAGEVVAAAVALLPDTVLPPVADSKLLTASRRRTLTEAITRLAAGIGIGCASVEEITRLNILGATRLAMLRAIEALPAAPEFLLVDGNPVTGLPLPQMSVIKGDRHCRAVAAASILAKDYRDRLMVTYDAIYPGYGFAAHKGYGSDTHLAALRELGPCPIHRLSFRGVLQGDLPL